MFVTELFDPAPYGYQDQKADQSVKKPTDSRTNRITLGHLHQLRISHDVRKLEHEKKLKDVANQYTPAPEPGAMPGAL